MKSQERELLWVWLKSIFVYSNTKIHKMLVEFKNPSEIFNAEKSEIEKLSYLTEKEKSELLKSDLAGARKILQLTNQLGVEVLCFDDSDYPECLKNIYDAPVVLYLKGNRACIDEKFKIAMVGTRKCDEFSKEICEKIAFELALSGAVIVSGMALGIDSAAHEGAINAGGKTIAVFGTAINKIYPAENIRIYNEIIKNGLIISEYPPGYRGSRYDFQKRNRIIAGLSLGVVVGQAPKRSGSLITARMALDSGRDVFALPGNVCEENEGTNLLIRDGCAKLALSAEDILEEYEDLAEKNQNINSIVKRVYQKKEAEVKTVKKYEGLSEFEEKVVKLISIRDMFLDELCEELDVNFNELGATLTKMELEDIVLNIGGKISLK